MAAIIPREWECLRILPVGLHFTLSCRSWEGSGGQPWKGTAMWAKERLHLSATACFKKSPSKDGKLKLPLLFSGEHRPVNLDMKGSNTRLFPRLFVSIASFWLCETARCLPSCVLAEAPAVPTLTVGSPVVRHSSGPCGEEEPEGLLGDRAHIFCWKSSHFFNYLFLTWLLWAHQQICSLGKNSTGLKELSLYWSQKGRDFCALTHFKCSKVTLDSELLALRLWHHSAAGKWRWTDYVVFPATELLSFSDSHTDDGSWFSDNWLNM